MNSIYGLKQRIRLNIKMAGEIGMFSTQLPAMNTPPSIFKDVQDYFADEGIRLNQDNLGTIHVAWGK